jgi:transposase InsO family protein
VHLTETLHLHGLSPSIGTVGDAYDNALAENTIGLYKTECIRHDSPLGQGMDNRVRCFRNLSARRVSSGRNPAPDEPARDWTR